MATDNLGIVEVTAAQEQKEVPINAGFRQLDNASQDGLPIVITADRTLTATEFNNFFRFELSGTPAAFTLYVPANKRSFAVKNDTGAACTVRVVGDIGTTTVVSDGDTIQLYSDATNVESFSAAGAATTFVALTDTPSAFTNKSGQFVRVNSAESALEFAALSSKEAVRVATDAAGTLATSFENGDTVDGVVLATGDRLLIKDQAAGQENGIYIVQATGAPTRADDFDDNDDPVAGGLIPVNLGTANADTIWQLDTVGPYTLDTTVLVFSQASGAAGGSTTGLQFIIDGGASAITTGVKGYVEVPFGATITAVRLLADQTGSIVVDVWKDTYANYPPTDADSITAAAVPTISSAIKSEDTTLTGWTTSITAGDIIGFNVDSATTIQRLTVSLTMTRP